MTDYGPAGYALFVAVYAGLEVTLKIQNLFYSRFGKTGNCLMTLINNDATSLLIISCHIGDVCVI